MPKYFPDFNKNKNKYHRQIKNINCWFITYKDLNLKNDIRQYHINIIRIDIVVYLEAFKCKLLRDKKNNLLPIDHYQLCKQLDHMLKAPIYYKELDAAILIYLNARIDFYNVISRSLYIQYTYLLNLNHRLQYHFHKDISNIIFSYINDDCISPTSDDATTLFNYLKL